MASHVLRLDECAARRDGTYHDRWMLYSVVSVQDMIACPYETRSDSFYFVDDMLIMHNKADYAYNGGLSSA